MSWGTLKTWVAGELVTAAMMNEQVRDKLAELYKYTTKGDLMVASGALSLARLGVGANGRALVADSTQAVGMRWGGVSPVVGYVEKTTEFSTASSTPVDVTGLTVSLTLPVTSTIVAWCTGTLRADQLYATSTLKLMIDGTLGAVFANKSCNSSSTDVSWVPYGLVYCRTGIAAGARIIKAQMYGSGTGNAILAAGNILALAYPES